MSLDISDYLNCFNCWSSFLFLKANAHSSKTIGFQLKLAFCNNLRRFRIVLNTRENYKLLQNSELEIFF
ncbi:hypothetical protein DF185_17120 [Marinifilum breve]|uniref:Uncharacterized protein n=1 Tax=Marinifilum breve TaxID=2184082 RepID=A0A2V3ZUG1_9BACT|nr:hypothetical protein DF185_17120 [Marinifilum breve]